jgi:hypothetical protein
MAAILIISIYGVSMFLLNGPLNYNPQTSKIYREEPGDPSCTLCSTSLHYFPTKELYSELASHSPIMWVPNMAIRAPLWFLSVPMA